MSLDYNAFTTLRTKQKLQEKPTKNSIIFSLRVFPSLAFSFRLHTKMSKSLIEASASNFTQQSWR